MTDPTPNREHGDAAPRRIQRQRTKGWRMPEGAVYVGRGSRWGNVYRHAWPKERERQILAEQFRRFAERWLIERPDWLVPLRGHDLACWCPLDQPCHADVLLELANR